jgi:hypothetical protein
MSGSIRHLSKTDLRRGLFTKAAPTNAPQPPTREIAIGEDEQMLLFGSDAATPPAQAIRGQPKKSPPG